jgi:hypothetical protein
MSSHGPDDGAVTGQRPGSFHLLVDLRQQLRFADLDLAAMTS